MAVTSAGDIFMQNAAGYELRYEEFNDDDPDFVCRIYRKTYFPQ